MAVSTGPHKAGPTCVRQPREKGSCGSNVLHLGAPENPAHRHVSGGGLPSQGRGPPSGVT